MRKPLVSTALIVLVSATVVGTAPAASADTAQACSEPTRALCVVSDAGTDVSKDSDNDYTTATNSQDVTAFFAVGNGGDQTQTVTITLTLDGPGASADRALTFDAVLAPDDIRQGSVFLFKVHKKGPAQGHLHLDGRRQRHRVGLGVLHGHRLLTVASFSRARQDTAE